MSTTFQSEKTAGSFLCYFFALCGVLIMAQKLEAQDKVYSSFRVLSPAGSSDTKSEKQVAAPRQAVWLSGTIERMGGGWTQGPHSSNTSGDEHHVAEVMTLDQNNIAKHSSVDTTQLAAFQDNTSILGQALEGAESQMAAPSDSLHSTPEESCLDCVTTSEKWIYWKSTSVSGAWLPGSGDRMGTTDLRVSGKILFSKFEGAFVIPTYQSYLLNGPNQTDVPGALHYAYVNFGSYFPISDRWLGMVSVAPGVASDFQTGSSKQIRITGVGMLIFKQTEDRHWTIGVTYLDREDVLLLPLFGVSWSPTERSRVELVFPRPRYKYQLSKSGEFEKWGYLGAEFGGGSWAINRANGTDDVVTIREYRLLGGVEHKLPQGRSWFWETGIVVGRSLEYSSGLGDYNPNSTLLLRGGVTY